MCFGVTPCLCQSWTSLRKTNYFFTPGASCPDTNIFTEKRSSLGFYLCMWYVLCTEAKDTATRQKNANVMRCCMRAPNVGLPTQRRRQAVLAARARKGSQGKAVENVQAEARVNISFSHANTGNKLWALCSKSFPLLQHHQLLPCHCVPCLQCGGREAGGGDFLTLLEPF